MRQCVAALVVGAVVGFLPVQAGAQATKEVYGTVTALGADSITVKAEGGERTFRVDESTTIIAPGASTKRREAAAAGRGVKLGDLLKVGQHVEVDYHEAGMHAATIRVLRSLPSGAAMRTRTASGVVARIDGNSLTIKGSGGESTYTIDSETEVFGEGAGTKTRALRDKGQRPTISDFVSQGDTVTVRYTEADGSRTATEVRITRRSPRS